MVAITIIPLVLTDTIITVATAIPMEEATTSTMGQAITTATTGADGVTEADATEEEDVVIVDVKVIMGAEEAVVDVEADVVVVDAAADAAEDNRS